MTDAKPAPPWTGGPHTLPLDEADRQLVLLALAHLSVERPGWDHALNRIALRIDNDKGDARAELYDAFRATRGGAAT